MKTEKSRRLLGPIRRQLDGEQQEEGTLENFTFLSPGLPGGEPIDKEERENY